MSSKKQCPEFPYFGAKYPDATCIDGYLWDLDKCDENGRLYGEGEEPCPFCNEPMYKDYLGYHDVDEEEKKRIDDHIKALNEKYNS